MAFSCAGWFLHKIRRLFSALTSSTTSGHTPPGPRREAWIASACGSDTRLRNELRALIAASEAAPRSFLSPLVDTEVALFVYEPTFAQDLRALQQTYIDGADRLDPDAWASRSFKERFLENTFRLVSPLL